MRHYDHIVVGAGASGLTAALLLALQGHEVLLLEKGPRLGGAMARFRRQGVPFDVGFHFTGGFGNGRTGMMDEMLRVLGIREHIQPIFFPDDHCHRIVFSAIGETHEIPSGIQRYHDKLKRDFPAEAAAIDAYFTRFRRVCEDTSSMTVRGLTATPDPLDEDYITLQQVLDELTDNPLLKALLSGLCMCYGTRPDEMSFANHCRCCYALYEATARVDGGGDALVQAFHSALNKQPVDIHCNTGIDRLLDIRDRQVGRFLLSSGEEVTCDHCVFTIHPLHILELFPAEHRTRAFTDRVQGFEPSVGFFSVFGTIDGSRTETGGDSPIFSIFPNLEVSRMMRFTPGEHDAPMVMLQSRETCADGSSAHVMTAFEISFFDEVAAWQDSRVGHRPADYYDYKDRRAARLVERLNAHFPGLKTSFRLLDSASMLTFRDYLHTPFGAAYGIKQKVAQYNLLGKLPLRNLYAAGQSAILPGVVGAMTSAFFVVRSVLGRDAFGTFIEEKLCR